VKTLLLRLALALIGLFRARAEAKAAQSAAEAERVEAVRKDAAIRETVASLDPGDAREKLRRNWRRPVVLLVLAIGVSACAGPRTISVDTACNWVRPIRVSDADQITDATARDILAHNETWAARCRR
jgi:hypothetical protein